MLVVGSAGMWALHLLLLAGDDWSRDLVRAANDGAPSGGTSTLTGLGSGLMFMLALAGIVTSIIQIVLLVVRNAAVVVLAGAWQVGAAASVSGDSTLWRRMTAWLGALVLYKPAAAIVYAAGFRLLREDSSYGGEILAAIQGMMLLALAVLALPAMIRLVVPAASLGGPSTAGLMAAGAGAIATGAMIRSGGLSSLVGAGASGDGGMPSGSSVAPPGSGPSGPPGGPGMFGTVGPSGSDGGDGAAGAAPAPIASSGGRGAGGGAEAPAAVRTSSGTAAGASGGAAGAGSGAAAAAPAGAVGAGAAAAGPVGVAVVAAGAAGKVAERTAGAMNEGGSAGASGASSSLPPEPQGAGS